MTKIQFDNWIPFPREIISSYRNKFICRNEYLTYLHLRLDCDPYGKCKTSISDIKNDILHWVSHNYVNKILLSLRKKKLIWFKNRQGVRGSFEVHFSDFILPNKTIKTLDKYFKQELVRSNISNLDIENSEVKPQVKEFSQKLKQDKKGLIDKFSMGSMNDKVRGSNNDNDNENNNDINDSNKSFKEIAIKDFIPRNHEEQKCKDIASCLGEKNMNFVLSAYRKYGLNAVERAYIVTLEAPNAQNKGKYFNTLVKEIGEG